MVAGLSKQGTAPDSFPEPPETTRAVAGNNVTAAGPLASMRAIEPVLDLLGNFNVQALDGIQCMVGPRYVDRLVLTSVLICGSIFIMWAVVGHLHLRACAGRRTCSRVAASARVATQGASSVATTMSIQIVFLLYPLACSLILRT